MPNHLIPPLSQHTYRRWMHIATLAAKMIGVQLRVHGQRDNLAPGEIFLFNHFTRLETAVPPLLLWQECGALTRSVTHHSLYHVHPWLRRFLMDTACVPSDLPNLLPYLAAEILRGRKIVIFPEGGLIKDKQVFSARGQYAVKETDSKSPRPHHRGAAVLAVYLDIFKAHIRDAHSRSDTATLAHWVAELNVPSPAALLAACAHPTRVVPSTMTFFPIRGESNGLVRLIEYIFGPLSDQVRDELAVESNLLLRTTDLDLHIGATLPPAWTPPKAELLLWRHALRHVRTLEQLFALDLDHAQWLHAPLAQRAQAAVLAQRDRGMRALYGGLTVNLHHVVATLIDEYREAGHSTVAAAEFAAALTWAVHRLQAQAAKNSSLSLHPSVATAAALVQLAQGTHPGYSRLMANLEAAKLVKLGEPDYRFSHRLDDHLGVHEIRGENPVLLHVNEAATQPAVRLAAMWGIQQAANPARTAAWAGMVLQTQRAEAMHAHVAASGAGLAAGAEAIQPFLLKPDQATAPANGVGVVLLHGLGATAAQSRPLAEELRALGYTVYGALLPGHGGQPADLLNQGAKAWVATAMLGVKMLQALGLQQLVMVGYSTGALVAVHAAIRSTPQQIQGMVLVAPPLRLVSFLRHGLHAMRGLNWLVAHTVGVLWPRARHGIMPWYNLNPAYPAEQYSRVPLAAVAALTRLSRWAHRGAARLNMPVTMIHGIADTVASFQATEAYAKRLPQGRLVALQGAEHDLLRTNTAHSWAHIIQAIQRTCSPNTLPQEMPQGTLSTAASMGTSLSSTPLTTRQSKPKSRPHAPTATRA